MIPQEKGTTVNARIFHLFVSSFSLFFLSLSFEILTGKEIIMLSTYSAVTRQSVVDGRSFAKG